MAENKSNRVVIIKTILMILVIIGGLWFINTRHPKNKDFFEVNTSYKNERYSGRTLKKFVDENQHYYHKVVLNSNGYNDLSDVIYLDSQIDLFNFIEVGDSLIKKSGEMQVRIIRESENLDTIYQMQFNNYTDD